MLLLYTVFTQVVLRIVCASVVEGRAVLVIRPSRPQPRIILERAHEAPGDLGDSDAEMTDLGE